LDCSASKGDSPVHASLGVAKKSTFWRAGFFACKWGAEMPVVRTRQKYAFKTRVAIDQRAIHRSEGKNSNAFIAGVYAHPRTSRIDEIRALNSK